MILLLIVLMVGFGLLRALAHRKLRRKLAHTPLAGFDTGVRSPMRAPRSVRFHKGL